MYGCRSTCPVIPIILCLALPSGAAFSDDDRYKNRYYETDMYSFSWATILWQQLLVFNKLSLDTSCPCFFLVFEEGISSSQYHPLDN